MHFFSFVPSSFLPLLIYERYLGPKGRQPFQRNMIAALLRKAFHLEVCDFLLEEKTEAFHLPSLPFFTTQNHSGERPCASEKCHSRHLRFQGLALNSIKITLRLKLNFLFISNCEIILLFMLFYVFFLRYTVILI